jgi:hypothetical protein
MVELYAVQIGWVLDWFPVRDGVVLDRPIMRNGTIHEQNWGHGPNFGAGLDVTTFLGEPAGLPPTSSAHAWASVLGDLNLSLTVMFEAQLGAVDRKLLLPAPPGQRLPFMLNIPAEARARSISDRDDGALRSRNQRRAPRTQSLPANLLLPWSDAMRTSSPGVLRIPVPAWRRGKGQ